MTARRWRADRFEARYKPVPPARRVKDEVGDAVGLGLDAPRDGVERVDRTGGLIDEPFPFSVDEHTIGKGEDSRFRNTRSRIDRFGVKEREVARTRRPDGESHLDALALVVDTHGNGPAQHPLGPLIPAEHLRVTLVPTAGQHHRSVECHGAVRAECLESNHGAVTGQ